ncbi:MAG: efflux RND transporter periplasmic adaptor subunit [Victivallales bacterium]|nr:efflux RND transporter periplasmic adaptor subunit [Victivallales bacterium]
MSKKLHKMLYVCPLFVIMAVVGSCGPGNKKEATKAKVVSVVEAKEVRLVECLETTGDVVAVNTVTLRATVEGPISYCPWREGDVIEKKGQKVIEIDRLLYREELAVKKAVLNDLLAGPRPEEIAAVREEVRHLESCTKFARIDLDRVNALNVKNVVSSQEREKTEVNYVKCSTQLEEARNRLKMLEEGTKKTELAIAEAQVALAQAKVDECIINAPFAGIVTQVYVRPGDLTHLSSPRMPLLKMMDPESLIVRAGLPENSAAHLSKGSRAKVRLDTYPGREFSGEIERIHPRIEWDSRTLVVEIRITEHVKLIPRMFARVSIEGRVFEKAVVVPDSAIITTPRGKHIVYTVKGGKAEGREAEIGIEDGDMIQVVKGVSAGEAVVIAGNLNLKNGSAVKVVASGRPDGEDPTQQSVKGK